MEVVRLALTWEDRLPFTVDGYIALRGIQYLESVLDQDEVEIEDAGLRLDTDARLPCAKSRC